MPYTYEVTFADFITQQYLDWRKDKPGHEGSQARFAREILGVKPQLLNEWMNRGKIPQESENIEKLAAAFGKKEVYEALGLPLSPLEMLPPGIREKMSAALEEINSRYATENISSDSPRAVEIADEVFRKIGLIRKS